MPLYASIAKKYKCKVYNKMIKIVFSIEHMEFKHENTCINE